MFELDLPLQRDCVVLGSFELCQLLLMNDSRYPWFILVPRRPGITEIFQLNQTDQQLLMAESCRLATGISRSFSPDKLNIAAIGNLVPQLHVHHVARYRTDAAWPAPVWGRLPAIPYDVTEVAAIKARISALQMNRFRPQS